ncbi:hypothetical protein ACHAWF_009497 [Thalassiosira exigua]
MPRRGRRHVRQRPLQIYQRLNRRPKARRRGRDAAASDAAASDAAARTDVAPTEYETPVTDEIIVINDNGDLDGGVTVSRSMPMILAGRLERSSWNSFCDKLDEALSPITTLKRAVKIQAMVLAVCVPLFVFVGVTFAMGSSMGGFRTNLFLVLFGAAIGGILSVAIYSARCRNNVNEGLKKACRDLSTLYQDITFRMKPELKYIKVCLSEDSIEDATTPAASVDSRSDESLNSSPTPKPPTTETTDVAKDFKWRSAVDENTGNTYYFHLETQETTWKKPVCFYDAVREEETAECNGKNDDGVEIEAIETGVVMPVL